MTKLLLLALACAITSPIAFAELRPLESYPKKSRLWIALVQGTIKPLEHQAYSNSSKGISKIKAEDGQWLTEGEVWAINDPQNLALQKRSLELLRLQSKLDTEDLDIKESEYLETVQAEITSLNTGKRELQAALDQNISAILKQRLQSGVQKIESKTQRLSLSITEEKLKERKGIQLTELDIKLQRAEIDYEDSLRSSTLKASFDGKLELSDEYLKPYKSNPEQFEISAGEIFATIVNDTEYVMETFSVEPFISTSDPNRLSIVIDLPGESQHLKGNYRRSTKSSQSGKIQTKYIFTLDPSQSQIAAKFFNQQRTVHVFKELPKSAHIVKKTDIALLAPRVLSSGGWRKLIQHLYPGSSYLLEGPDSIAVAP